MKKKREHPTKGGTATKAALKAALKAAGGAK